MTEVKRGPGRPRKDGGAVAAYEQYPDRHPEQTEDDYKRIRVERKPTERSMDCQIPRFKRLGYEIEESSSDEEFVTMKIPMSVYDQRAKDREEKTTRMLLESASSGIDGEFANTTTMTRRTPEEFFDGPENDSE